MISRRNIMSMLAGSLAVIAAAVLVFLVYNEPTRLTIAVGPNGGYDASLIDAIALRLQNRHESIQLKVVRTNGSVSSAEALDAGKVDLAVIRGDLPKQPSAGLVVTLHRDPVLFLTQAYSGIKTIPELKGKRIGVIRARVIEGDGLSVNTVLLKTILDYYTLNETMVTIVPMLIDDAAQAFESKSVDAIFYVGPLNEPELVRVVNNLAAALPIKPAEENDTTDSAEEQKTVNIRGAKQKNKASSKNSKKANRIPSIFIPLSEPEALIIKNPLLTKDDIVRGVFSGKPPTPSEAIPTISVTHSIAANNNLSDTVIADLTRNIIKIRPIVARDIKIAANIEVPSSDKNAAMPLHPGAAAYVDNDEQGFFDLYGDLVYIAATLLGVLGSGFAALFSRWSSNARSAALEHIEESVNLVSEARSADTLDSVNAVELKADNLVEKVVRNAVQAHLNQTDLASFNISINHVRQALNDKRRHFIWQSETIGKKDNLHSE